MITKSFEEIKERDCIDWLIRDKDIIEIENNLKFQLENIEKTKKIGLPWMANTFKVEI